MNPLCVQLAPGRMLVSALQAVVDVTDTTLLISVCVQLAPGRMLMSARCKLWWMTPEWRSSTLALPPETQFLLVSAI